MERVCRLTASCYVQMKSTSLSIQFNNVVMVQCLGLGDYYGSDRYWVRTEMLYVKRWVVSLTGCDVRRRRVWQRGFRKYETKDVHQEHSLNHPHSAIYLLSTSFLSPTNRQLGTPRYTNFDSQRATQ